MIRNIQAEQSDYQLRHLAGTVREPERHTEAIPSVSQSIITCLYSLVKFE